MTEAFIIDAVRTPVGRRGGGLAGAHPADLGAHVISALLGRTGVDPLQSTTWYSAAWTRSGRRRATSPGPARLAAALPEAVPGVTVDRQCGSSQQAVHFAAQAVLSGTADVVVAGGVQNMSQDPDRRRDAGRPAIRVHRPVQRLGRLAIAVRRRRDLPVPRGADQIAEKWGIGRAENGGVRAGQSPAGGQRAIDDGYFAAEIAPYGDVAADECPRRDTSPERMAGLQPLRDGGPDHRRPVEPDRRRRRGAADRLSDAAPLAAHGLTPRARIHHLSARGDDPVLMLTAPIAATAHALQRTPGLTLGQIDLVEINEAFASARARVAAGDRRGPRPGQRLRRRHRARPPAGRDRRPAADDAAPRRWSAPAAGTDCSPCAKAAARPT